MDGVPPKNAEDSARFTLEVKRVRLLAAVALFGGLGFAFAMPFMLRAGAEFFLPVTAAMVIAIALVPMLEWFERRGLPSALAALASVVTFILFMIFVIASIVLPAIDWFALLPERIGRVRIALAPVVEFYNAIENFIDNSFEQVAGVKQGDKVFVDTPNSMLDLFTTSAPLAAIQTFFALLVVFFFLSSWTRMRERTITSRGSFEGALTTARVIQQVVDATSTYIGTITVVNLLLGTTTGLILWLLGMDSPIMWGGIVAVLNFVPYLGPILAAILLALGGIMSFTDPFAALLPPLIFVGLHLVEANAITPMIVGKRVRISPLLILISLSFWAWVWGTAGALLAIPLLIIMRTVFSAAGTPDIAGFLFEHGTLTHAGEPDDEDDD